MNKAQIVVHILFVEISIAVCMSRTTNSKSELRLLSLSSFRFSSFLANALRLSHTKENKSTREGNVDSSFLLDRACSTSLTKKRSSSYYTDFLE